jgi:hypothetical protein
LLREEFERRAALARWFNDHAHHRGHLHALLTAASAKLDRLVSSGDRYKIRGLTSRKLHRLACKVDGRAFALPEPMQQNCASGVMNTP